MLTVQQRRKYSNIYCSLKHSVLVLFDFCYFLKNKTKTSTKKFNLKNPQIKFFIQSRKKK